MKKFKSFAPIITGPFKVVQSKQYFQSGTVPKYKGPILVVRSVFKVHGPVDWTVNTLKIRYIYEYTYHNLV